MATSTTPPAKKAPSRTNPSTRIEPYSKSQLRLDALALAIRTVEQAPFKGGETASTITTQVLKTHKKFVDAIFPDEAGS